MNTFMSDVVLVTELNSLVINRDFTITTVLSNNDNIAEVISWGYFDTFGVLEADLSRLIIINNGDSCFGILANKFGHGIWVIKLNKEVLIWLPVVIILDTNIKSLGVLTLGKFDDSVKWDIILICLGISVNSCNSDSTCITFFI